MTYNPSIRAEYLFQDLDKWVEQKEDQGFELDLILSSLAEYLDVCEDLFYAGK